MVFLKPGEHNILHHLFQTAKAFQAKQQSNPTWTPGQLPLKTVMAIALFQELGVRLERTCTEEAIAYKSTGTGLERPGHRLEVSTVEPNSEVPGGGHHTKTAHRPRGEGLAVETHTGSGGRHGPSLQCHQEASGHRRGEHHISTRPLHPHATGPRSMGGPPTTTGQRGTTIGGGSIQTRNTPTQPHRQEDQGDTPTVLRLVLGNHTNCCYMNSLVQALLWTVHMVQADGATLGRAHSLLTALQRSHTAQPKYLMRDLTWRMLMSGWAESHRQHDVVEFTAFFLQRHNITLAQRTWHARRLHDGHIQVRDMGQCTQPITLRIPTVPPGLNPTVQVQSLIDFWSGDPTSECIQALVQQPQTLFLQVDRFEVSTGRVHKRLDKVEANHILAVPVFFHNGFDNHSYLVRAHCAHFTSWPTPTSGTLHSCFDPRYTVLVV